MKKAAIQFIGISFILLFSFKQSAAQTDFAKVYFEQEKALRSSSVVNAYDGSYIISGTRESQNFFFKINSMGEVLWIRFISAPYSGGHSDIISLMDSTFLRLSTYHEPDSINSKAMLLNIDTNGDTIWTRLIDYDTTVFSFYVHQTIDAGFIATNMVRQGTPPNNVLYNTAVTKLDVSASLQWSKVYAEGLYFNQGKTVKQTPDGGYIVSGIIEDEPPDIFNIFLLKLTTEGNISWSNRYPILFTTEGEWHDIVLVDDGFIVSAMDQTDLILMKTDLSGNVLWAKKYSTHSIDYTMHRIRIRQLSDGKMAVLSPDNLIKIDGSGNIIWAKDLMMKVADFVEATDKGFLIIGNGPLHGVKSPPSNDDHIGIVKTDSLGYSSSECISDATIAIEDISMTAYPITFTVEDIGSVSTASIPFTSVTITIEEGCVAFLSGVNEDSFDNNIQIFPNPTNGSITIQSTNGEQLNSLEVYNTFGEQVYRINDLKTNEATIDLSAIPSGIYFLKLVINDKKISRKLVLY